MYVLVVGNGGREHALAWKLAQSRKVKKVYVAPGNAGTHNEPSVENINISSDDYDGLMNFALDKQIDLTIIGPEVPLVEGIVDRFSSNGIKCFGPSKKAAQLEGSKSFTKNFLRRHKIPTAEYECFSDIESAVSYVSGKEFPLVIKADGLAAGKGVIIANSFDEAEITIKDMLADDVFGKAGHKIVIEEFLEGEEASFIVVTDGKTILPMATSQDHKCIWDGDKGPNTGGMGAYSPAPVVTSIVHEKIMNEIIKPTVEGMAKDGMTYSGFLYAGLMINKMGQPKVIEYNCRFGDPETQPIMMRLESDLFDLCQATTDKNLSNYEARWCDEVALGVVLASSGYPGKYAKGEIIKGLNDIEDSNCKVFHAGTKIVNENIVTNGGRVLCVTALGNSTRIARENTYKAIEKISWEGMQYRKDIGYRAIKREECDQTT